ncbi:MAG: hypothetical protein HZA95_03495 [Candidatus Vogelbacteria bacterium]|nr:hypothetical protein [Candidatus Vogelbacteria bacterium]
MKKEPQKMWPIFALGAVVVLAIVLKIYTWIFSGETLPPAEYKAVVGPVGTSTGLAFNMANWQINPSTSSNEFSSVEPMKNFTDSDIKKTSDNGKTRIKMYATALKSALAPYSDPKQKSAPEILMKVYETNDPAELSKLLEAKNNHQTALNSLLAIEVPSDIARYHLVLINSVGRLHFLVNNMLKVGDKPVLALTSARIFGSEVNRFADALTVLNNVFYNKGLVFEEKDEVRIYLTATK